jgi:sortase A
MIRTFSFVLLGIGTVLLLGTLGPIFYHQLNYYFNDSTNFIDPTFPTLDGAISTTTTTDYTQTSSWFSVPNVSKTSYKTLAINSYLISIPSLNLPSTIVQIYSSDLKSGPIHYFDTALPGQPGNGVVFGHSTLPQLYEPHSPLSIFNHLPNIKPGDKILVTYDRITYTYVVRETKVVKPTQIEVLNQKLDRHELTLITCVPLGTYLRRFVARAELVK